MSDERTKNDAASSAERIPPVGRTLFLALSFAIIATVGVFTVLFPVLEDAPENAGADTSEGAGENGDTRDTSGPPADAPTD